MQMRSTPQDRQIASSHIDIKTSLWLPIRYASFQRRNSGGSKVKVVVEAEFFLSSYILCKAKPRSVFYEQRSLETSMHECPHRKQLGMGALRQGDVEPGRQVGGPPEGGG